MAHFAHSNPAATDPDRCLHALDEHLREVARIAARFAGERDAHWAHLAGIWFFSPKKTRARGDTHRDQRLKRSMLRLRSSARWLATTLRADRPLQSPDQGASMNTPRQLLRATHLEPATRARRSRGEGSRRILHARTPVSLLALWRNGTLDADARSIHGQGRPHDTWGGPDQGALPPVANEGDTESRARAGPFEAPALASYPCRGFPTSSATASHCPRHQSRGLAPIMQTRIHRLRLTDSGA